VSAAPLRRARALSAALLLAVFTAGFLAGAAMDRALASRDDRPQGKSRGLRGMETEVLERLDLDARQRAAIETIFERRREEAAAVWSEVKPRLNQVVAGTREDLSRVLTPEQLGEYDRLMAERWKRGSSWERRRPAGSERPGK
jgi:Spy/CpxP family protein refolding chaperone